jgi:uncharacterized protein RhaS with RHS repeats
MEAEGYGYESAMGRAYWPSRDPIGERGGINLYGMVRNNPVKYIDYLGLKLRLEYLTEAEAPGVDNLLQINQDWAGKVIRDIKQLCPSVGVASLQVHTTGTAIRSDRNDGCCCLFNLIQNDHDNVIKPRLEGKHKAEPDTDQGYQQPGPGDGWSNGQGSAGTAYINPNLGYVEGPRRRPVPSYIVLAHELCGHVLSYNKGVHQRGPRNEDGAIDAEGPIREEQMQPPRQEPTIPVPANPTPR